MKNFLCIAALLSLTVGVAAQEADSAKSQFFDADAQGVRVATEPAGQKTRLGASYFIRLKNPDGSVSDVLASRQFKSGDRFQLGVKVNRLSYVTIFNETADGKVTQLYPPPGQPNRVGAMGVVFLPKKGAFEFDGEPGVEQLTVVLAQSPQKQEPKRLRTKTPDLVSDPARQFVASTACNTSDGVANNVAVASADTHYAAKGIVMRIISSPCDATPPAFAAKGIVFSNDPEPVAGGQVASYVVKPLTSSEDTLMLTLKLVHK